MTPRTARPELALVAVNGSGALFVMPTVSQVVLWGLWLVLLPGAASASVAGCGRPGGPRRRRGDDGRESTGTWVTPRPVRAGGDAGAHPLSAEASRSTYLGPASGGVVDRPPVLLRRGRLQRLHVRRAGSRVDRTARPPQRRSAGSPGGGRVALAARTGCRLAAELGMGGEPVAVGETAYGTAAVINLEPISPE